MRSGATFERRFVLVSPEQHDLPGVERWIAKDERLRRTVTAFIVTSVAPSAVRRAASRATGVGDPRLARVLASGTSDGRVDGRKGAPEEQATYVVVERPDGRSLDSVLARRNLSHALASGVIGTLAQALLPLLGRGLHHGAIRAGAVTVTDAGSVMLSGLGIDGELAIQGGIGDGATESADARALAGLYVLALTGRAASEASPDDLPDDVPPVARSLAERTIAGDAPTRLREVAEALGGSRAALRGFASQVITLPVRPEVLAGDVRDTFGRPGVEVAAAEALTHAAEAATRATAMSHADDAVAYAIAAERLDEVARPLLEAERHRKAVAAREAAAAAAAARAAAAPTAEEREQFDDLQSWDVIAEAQNATVPPSAWEALMVRLQRHWPSSQALAARVDEAHARARRPGPLVGAPIIIGFALLGVIVALVYALGQMPAAGPGNGEQSGPDPYPAFTYPTTTYTPQPEPSPEE